MNEELNKTKGALINMAKHVCELYAVLLSFGESRMYCKHRKLEYISVVCDINSEQQNNYLPALNTQP